MMVLAVALAARQAVAVEPLTSQADLTELCSTSAPLTTGDAAEEPAKLVQYLERRRSRLLDAYSVVVMPRHFGLASYDAKTDVLLLATEDLLLTQAGAVHLQQAPILAFTMDQDAYEEARASHAGGRLRLRVTFVLDSLWRPEGAYCSASDGPSRTVVRGRPMAAELFEEGADEPIGKQSFAIATELEQRYGISLSAGQRGRLSVRVEDPKPVSGAAGPDGLRPTATAVEELLFPCFLSAIAHGGPTRAALVLEVDFDARGASRSAAVAVDATGFPPLGACSVDMLEHLSAGEAPASHRVRFNTYFELR